MHTESVLKVCVLLFSDKLHNVSVTKSDRTTNTKVLWKKKTLNRGFCFDTRPGHIYDFSISADMQGEAVANYIKDYRAGKIF